MSNLILIFPFMRKGGDTLLYSQLVSLEKNATIFLSGKALNELSGKVSLHSSSLHRKLDQLVDNPYFQVIRKEKKVCIIRTDKSVSYKGILFPQEPLKEFNLSTSETIIFSALMYYHLSNKLIPPRYKLASMTGYSMRQVAYALKSLTQKKLLIETTQHESYVRVTKAEGRVVDMRDRKVHVINPDQKDLIKHCKIAPLKENNINPVNTNGFKISAGIEIIKLYKQTLSGSLPRQASVDKILAQRKNITVNKVKEALKVVQKTPFLKTAHRFGWQEAVTECYQRKQGKIWINSKHLEKYSGKKLGLLWILTHLDEILRGKYDQKALSAKARKSFEGKGNLTYTHTNLSKSALISSLEEDPNREEKRPFQRKSTKEPETSFSPPPLARQIAQSAVYSEEEKALRLKILAHVGEGTYRTWFDRGVCVLIEKGKTFLKAATLFHQDRIQTLLLSSSLPRCVSLLRS